MHHPPTLGFSCQFKNNQKVTLLNTFVKYLKHLFIIFTMTFGVIKTSYVMYATTGIRRQNARNPSFGVLGVYLQDISRSTK